LYLPKEVQKRYKFGNTTIKPICTSYHYTTLHPNATRNERRKQKRAQETLQQKEQRRLERRQKYAARDPETIESQRKRSNERDCQTYVAMDKDEKH
jgi:hypothetical protein